MEGILRKRWAQCLALTIDGKRVKDIAEILCISPRTVENHLSAAKMALDAETLTQACIIYDRANR